MLRKDEALFQLLLIPRFLMISIGTGHKVVDAGGGALASMKRGDGNRSRFLVTLARY